MTCSIARSAESYLLELAHFAFPMKDPEAEADTGQLPSLVVKDESSGPSCSVQLCVLGGFTDSPVTPQAWKPFLSMPYKK